MRAELVEIYGNTPNAAVMRHPGRRFPGILVQGDTLSILHTQAADLCDQIEPSSNAFEIAKDIKDHLFDLLMNYERVLAEHGIELPYFRSR